MLRLPSSPLSKKDTAIQALERYLSKYLRSSTHADFIRRHAGNLPMLLAFAFKQQDITLAKYLFAVSARNTPVLSARPEDSALIQQPALYVTLARSGHLNTFMPLILEHYDKQCIDQWLMTTIPGSHEQPKIIAADLLTPKPEANTLLIGYEGTVDQVDPDYLLEHLSPDSLASLCRHSGTYIFARQLAKSRPFTEKGLALFDFDECDYHKSKIDHFFKDLPNEQKIFINAIIYFFNKDQPDMVTEISRQIPNDEEHLLFGRAAALLIKCLERNKSITAPFAETEPDAHPEFGSNFMLQCESAPAIITPFSMADETGTKQPNNKAGHRSLHLVDTTRDQPLESMICPYSLVLAPTTASAELPPLFLYDWDGKAGRRLQRTLAAQTFDHPHIENSKQYVALALWHKVKNAYIGLVYYRYNQAHQSAKILSLYIEEAYRKQQLGLLLLYTTLSLLNDKQIKHVRLNPTSPQLLKFYSKLGFACFNAKGPQHDCKYGLWLEREQLNKIKRSLPEPIEPTSSSCGKRTRPESGRTGEPAPQRQAVAAAAQSSDPPPAI